jgi:Family of unknown function (DUF6335)
MAKRKAKAGGRKAGRKSPTKATRKASARKTTTRRKAPKPARKAPARKTARPKARVARKPSKPARKAAPTARARVSPKRPEREGGRPTSSRPKPAALARPRRQLREDETVPGAPSSFNFAAKASAAESGHQMYNQRAKEHTEGGSALTGGDVDSDWNDAYSSGEETPGGDMSTPDQDVVEEIGRALGVEYEDAEELKGAEKIESRDRNRWEYDPASAEDYKDRNRRKD